MVEKKETMLRAAYTAEGARHSKSVIFWLGGGWKFPFVLLVVTGLAWLGALGLRWLQGHGTGPLLLILVTVAFVALLVAVLARGGRRRGGRRR